MIDATQMTLARFRAIEAGQVANAFSDYWDVPGFFDASQIARRPADLQQFCEVFDRPSRNTNICVPVGPARGHVDEGTVQDYFADIVKQHGAAIPGSLRAPLEVALRCLVADSETEERRFWKAMYQDVAGIISQYIPLFYCAGANSTVLYVLCPSQNLHDFVA